jgi:phage-related protein
MAAYPNLPDNRLIVNGVDITAVYGLILVDGYTLEPPEPKTYTVDIPGGNGTIDLTEALTGDVSYENRSQEFTFDVLYPDDFEKTKTNVMNFLHGRAYDYTMTMDPGYTYHGRFTVESFEHAAYANGIVGEIKVKIEANPYKTKGTQVFKLNATGGKFYRFESGRRKVYPVIECEQVCFFTLLPNGSEITVPAGTHRLNDVLFESGFNECWVNTQKFWDISYDEVGEGAKFASTWDDLGSLRWDEVQSLGQKSESVTRSWDDLATSAWADLAEKHWYDLNWTKREMSDSTAYLTYEWEDL